MTDEEYYKLMAQEEAKDTARYEAVEASGGIIEEGEKETQEERLEAQEQVIEAENAWLRQAELGWL